MDVKAELQYRLVIDLLERMTREGLLKSGELTRAKRLAKKKYCPQQRSQIMFTMSMPIRSPIKAWRRLV